MGRIEFLPSPEPTTLQKIFNERLIDWHEAGAILLTKMKKHKENYRKKICSKCSPKQQEKRKCVKYTINGKELQSCGHMDSACGQYFKEEMNAHMNFHPANPPNL